MFQFDLREIGAASFPEDINKGKLDSVSICKQQIFSLLETGGSSVGIMTRLWTR